MKPTFLTIFYRLFTLLFIVATMPIAGMQQSKIPKKLKPFFKDWKGMDQAQIERYLQPNSNSTRVVLMKNRVTIFNKKKQTVLLYTKPIESFEEIKNKATKISYKEFKHYLKIAKNEPISLNKLHILEKQPNKTCGCILN